MQAPRTFVRTVESRSGVMPAKAGIHFDPGPLKRPKSNMDSHLRGNDGKRRNGDWNEARLPNANYRGLASAGANVGGRTQNQPNSADAGSRKIPATMLYQPKAVPAFAPGTKSATRAFSTPSVAARNTPYAANIGQSSDDFAGSSPKT